MNSTHTNVPSGHVEGTRTRVWRSCTECRVKKIRCICTPSSPKCNACLRRGARYTGQRHPISEIFLGEKATLRSRVERIERIFDLIQSGDIESLDDSKIKNLLEQTKLHSPVSPNSSEHLKEPATKSSTRTYSTESSTGSSQINQADNKLYSKSKLFQPTPPAITRINELRRGLESTDGPKKRTKNDAGTRLPKAQPVTAVESQQHSRLQNPVAVNAATQGRLTSEQYIPFHIIQASPVLGVVGNASQTEVPPTYEAVKETDLQNRSNQRSWHSGLPFENTILKSGTYYQFQQIPISTFLPSTSFPPAETAADTVWNPTACGRTFQTPWSSNVRYDYSVLHAQGDVPTPADSNLRFQSPEVANVPPFPAGPQQQTLF